MPHELIKERMMFGETVANDTIQLLLEGDIIVPDIKPDMAVVLKTEAEARIERVELSSDRISFTGKLMIKVLYLCKGENKSVHSMSVVHAIDDFMNMEGVGRDMWAMLGASIANIDFKMLNDRKLSYKSVIDVSASVEGKCDREIVKTITDIPGDHLKMNTLEVNRTIESKEDRFIIKEEVGLSTGKPDIREILQSGTRITNKDIKLSTGRASISGDLAVYILYKSDAEDGIIEFFETELPFNGAVDIPQARDGYIADLCLVTDNEYIQVKTNSDGEDRILDIEISVQAKIVVSSQNSIEVLEDAFIVDKNIDLKRDSIVFPQLVCRNKNQCSVKEIVEIGETCPDILQILKVNGRVVIDSKKVIDDKVIVEGIIETDILYIANNDDTPLYDHAAMIPFKQVIETRGAAPDMEVKIDENIDHIGFNMLSDREVELRFLISFNTSVCSRKRAELVVDAEICDIDAHVLNAMPSIIIYVVQKGDTLWDIAKRYNVSLDELADLNEIENKNLIFPGQKILILKRLV